MDYDFSQKAIESTLETGASFVNSKLKRSNYSWLRKYFDIDDSYLLAKIRLILFPFRHGTAHNETGSQIYTLYRPDMYIPILSMITRVLLNGFILGLSRQFHPELLYLSFTRSVGFHALLCLGYKFMAYIMGTSIGYADIFAIAGYKFFVSILTRLCRLNVVGYGVGIYLFIAFFLFISRTLKNVLLVNDRSKKTLHLLFLIALLELVFLFFL